MSNTKKRIIWVLAAVLVLPLGAIAVQKLAAKDEHAGHDHANEAKAAAKDEHAGHDHANEAKTVAKDEHAGHDHANEAKKDAAAHDEDEGHKVDEAKDEHAGHGHEEEAKDDHDDHDDHEGEAEDAHAGEAGGSKLNPEQRKLFGITLAKAGAGMLKKELRLTGEIALNADRVAHMVPRASGIVREVHKSVGMKVAAGELLAVLESMEVGEAKVAFLGQRRTLELAELDLRRAQAVRTSTVAVLKALAANPAASDLGKLNGREMGEGRGRILSAYAERAAARREYERERTLVAKKVGTETELVAAGNALHKAEAEYDALRDSLEFGSMRGLHDAERGRDDAAFALATARRKLAFQGVPESEIARLEKGVAQSLVAAGLNRIELRAPVGGTIIEKHIALGERLNDDAEVYTIADLSTVWTNLTVHARDLTATRKGAHAMVSSRFRDGGTKGEVSMISPLVDEETRTATARIVLDNADGHWRPGMFVTADVELSAEEGAVVVPKAAVQTVEGESVVFIEHEGAFETKVVRLGRADHESVEIVAGLAPGDVYVMAGAFELKARAVTSNLDPHAGHGH